MTIMTAERIEVMGVSGNISGAAARDVGFALRELSSNDKRNDFALNGDVPSLKVSDVGNVTRPTTVAARNDKTNGLG